MKKLSRRHQIKLSTENPIREFEPSSLNLLYFFKKTAKSMEAKPKSADHEASMDSVAITFVIPVCHPDNSRDWVKLKKDLSQTIKSISNQTSSNWRAVIVANRGADLPEIPERFHVEHVDFPPNDKYDKKRFSIDVVLDSVRFDKGRRVLAGILSAQSTKFYMTVDCDDLISNRLASYVEANQSINGWYFKYGYVWEEGKRVIYRHAPFWKICGTSHIVKKDLLDLPLGILSAKEDYIKTYFGSHRRIKDILGANGAPLAPLPFIGAVYRIGHRNAHSGCPGILRMFLVNKKTIINPIALAKCLQNIKLVNDEIKKEFWGH